ncbi:MAG TPA: hypothetical protein VGO59_06215 [Verrucomicrobiae bacterium]
MKTRPIIFLLAALLCARPGMAQRQPAAPRATASGDYATDLATVDESQQQALGEARQMLQDADNPAARAALKTAITAMESADKALKAAKKNKSGLASAVTAEQAAYQALLKLTPHEYRVNRSRRNPSQGGAGRPNQRQMEQLDTGNNEDRYETERQASSQPNEQQRQQLEAADKLKQMSQRQQDLNGRLRELQTALQQARTEQEKEEINRELKHLADEERQMLSDIDDLRQKLDQAPSSSSLSQTSRDLDQTRTDTEKAARELANQSVSQALAAGTRAQQSLQNSRENLRNRTSSQFSNQMRQLQSQARDLAKKEDDIGRSLESMDNSDHKTLDDSRQRQQLAQQISAQQGALTNLLSTVQDVTEKAESAEPLLSEQLYDTLRRNSQKHTDSLLEASSELLDRGFLAKSAEAERAARTNINELRDRIDRAAESVLGSQSEALRYAQSELNDLAKGVERDVAKITTNNSAAASGAGTNDPQRKAQAGAGSGNQSLESRLRQGQNGQRAGEPSQSAEQASRNRQQGNREGQQGGQANRNGQQGARQGEQPSRDGQQGERQGEQASRNGQQGDQPGNQQNGSGNQQNDANNQAARGGAGRLSELVRQMGGAHGASGTAGPILGDDFANWADRMRDVEQVVDSTDLRNRLAAIRERAAAFRADYRFHDRRPAAEAVKKQILQPMTDVIAELQEDLARMENAHSLVPLDHDPVPDNYTELVRKYYEKLGGGQ